MFIPSCDTERSGGLIAVRNSSKRLDESCSGFHVKATAIESNDVLFSAREMACNQRKGLRGECKVSKSQEIGR